jgi:hypothetical protein
MFGSYVFSKGKIVISTPNRAKLGPKSNIPGLSISYALADTQVLPWTGQHIDLRTIMVLFAAQIWRTASWRTGLAFRL